MLRIMPRAGAGAVTLFFFLVFLQSVLPLGFMVATALLVGELPNLATNTAITADRTIVLSLGALALLYAAQQVLAPVRQAVEEIVGERLQDLLRSQLMATLLAPNGIAHLERPQIINEVENARGIGQQGQFDRRAVWALGEVLVARLQGIIAAVIVFQFRWWAPLLILGAEILQVIWNERELSTLTSRLEQSAPGLRRSRYFRDLALSEGPVKEVRLFGLTDWIVSQFATHWLRTMHEVWNRRNQHRWWMLASITALIVSNAVVYIALGRAAFAGTISLSALVFYAQAVLGMEALGIIGEPERVLQQASRSVPAIEQLPGHIADSGANLNGTRTAADLPRHEIRLTEVTFRYPGSNQNVLSNLDLTIPAGQSLAIVGVNGAGKTSLIKLLTRLYEPTHGTITVDGIDLKTIDPDAWRARLAIIFQDFVKYHLSARENLSLGWPERMAEDDEILAALSQADLAELIASFPQGIETPLSRNYPGGQDLSGGQWQRIALARALFAAAQGADVLILEEPTANLDIRIETALFEHLLTIMRDKTCILVSHRMSSVRRADGIVVLDEGQVVEEGTHESLLALGGRYAHLFYLQSQPLRGER